MCQKLHAFCRRGTSLFFVIIYAASLFLKERSFLWSVEALAVSAVVAAFAALAERRVALAGMAGISLEEYAACLSTRLSASDKWPRRK